MNNDVTGGGGVHLSVIAGIFATIGSLFGKLAGGVYFTTMVSARENAAAFETRYRRLQVNPSSLTF